jgi:hypothetical protein
MLIGILGINSISYAGCYAGPPSWAYEVNDNVPEFVDVDGNPIPNLYIERNQMIIADTYDVRWAQPAIAYCAEQGYLDGMLSRKHFFSPRQAVDKLELAIFLGRIESIDYRQYSEEAFSDIRFEDFDLLVEYDYTDWAFNLSPYYVNWAAQAGILLGTGQGTLDNNEITREHIAVMIDRYIEKFTPLYKGLESDESLSFQDRDQISSWAKESISRLSVINLLNGDNNGNFNPKSLINRAEICQIIYNISESLKK